MSDPLDAFLAAARFAHYAALVPLGGAWLGAALPLAALSRRGAPAVLAPVLIRFAGVGLAAAAVLIGTGLVNPVLLVGTPGALLATPYGRLLGLKLLLFAA